MREFDNRHWTQGGTLITKTMRIDTFQRAITEYGDPNLQLRGVELHWLGEEKDIPDEDKQAQMKITYMKQQFESLYGLPDIPWVEPGVWGKDLSGFWRIVRRIEKEETCLNSL